MRQPGTPYGQRRATRRFDGFDVERPIAGTYAMKLRPGAVPAAIRIWHGPPHDPITGEEMDRSWRWQATANGELIDLERVWPKCAASGVDVPTYDRMMALRAWARDAAPASPHANPLAKVDLRTAPLPF